MTALNRQSQEFFESRYQGSVDPWELASSPYELGRYHATLNALARSSYRRAYEPGCSVGVLTLALSRRCAQVVACDISATAAHRAQQRCAHCDNVDIEQRDAAKSMPRGRFDLIVFSEIGYYFSPVRLCALTQDLAARLELGGEFMAVHWLGESADHILHGDEVHEILDAHLGCEPLLESRQPGFRLNSWRRGS